MAGNRRQLEVGVLKSLWSDFGKPAVDAALTALPDGTEKQLREALGVLTSDAAASVPAPRIRVQKPSGRAPLTTLAVEAPAIVRNVSGANRRAAAGAKYDVDALAVRYPETLPSKEVFYKDKGKLGPQKQRSAEQDALSVARRAVQVDIDAGNYTPVFDVAKRDYVDPGNYPITGNTRLNVPTLSKSLAVHVERANDPEGLGRFADAAKSMVGHPGAEDWYAVQQLEQAFIDKYGPELGREMFRKHFAEAMGSTTGGMSPRDNYVMAQYGNFMSHKGSPIVGESSELPYPIGGAYLRSNIDTFNRVVHGGGDLVAATQPKRFNFTGSFLGHLDRPPLDKQITSWIRPGLNAPPSHAYGVYEEPIHRIAASFDRPATRIQDIGWAGIKKIKEPDWEPISMMGNINEAIERTARLTGRDPDEVLDLSILGAKRPTYARGGAVRGCYAVEGV